MEWSHLEYKVEQTLWEILGLTWPGSTSDKGPAVTTHIPFRVRLDMISSMVRAHELHKECIDEWDEIVSEINEQHYWRNLVIHHEWYNHGGPTQHLKYRKARKGVETKLYQPDPKQLDDTANDIKAVRERLTEWATKNVFWKFSLNRIFS